MRRATPALQAAAALLLVAGLRPPVGQAAAIDVPPAASAAPAAKPAPGAPPATTSGTAEIDRVFRGRAPHEVAWKGDLSGMNRLIRVLVPHNRTFFFYDGLQPRGLAYEFMTEFTKQLAKGRKADPELQVLFIPAARDRFITDVAKGYADIAMAGLTVTASRERQVEFVPYERTMNEIVVTGPDAPSLSAVEDLAGKMVFVRRSSSYYESLVALSARLKSLGRPPVRIKLADEDLETEDILELVNAGVVAITVCDGYLAKMWAPVLPEIRVRSDLVTRANARLGPVIRKGSPELRKALRDFIRTHGPGTTFGNIVLERYTAGNRWVRNPGVSEDRKRFREALPFFEKYAKQYDFDHLLIAAQAYQESRIDQRLKSPAGAVGVMQIKPATAADPNVGIPDVQSMERNIHAGVKYLRFISNRYFPDARFDALNRHVFAFAAYNAGPARVQKLRTEAATEGLDPDRWFNSVEIIAGREVGREPVDYVRNILKYWVAYRLALEQEKESEATQRTAATTPGAAPAPAQAAPGPG